MIIDNGVEILKIEAEAFGSKTTLYPTLIKDDESAVLVDVGMPGGWEQIQAVMTENGVEPKKLKAIILTHQDLDHIGSIEEIKQELGNSIIVYAHELDKPYIEGSLPLIKTTPSVMAPMIELLPEKMRQEALDLCENPPKVKVDQTVVDGQELPYCGGIRIIHTPGHTEGHISLYLQQSKTLIAADAMLCIDGKLHGPVPQTSLDLPKAQRSLVKFLDYEIETVICYHGGLCEWGAKDQIEQLVKEIREL
ncbi:MBL fold metallo-hydrolase [Bacillus songklensis]|uniref:MBL fold metallo-hydrolase n=1 Tax=Bacillus songklensis TaxID=1069116 RepID=A0ABV8B3T8_9BACI